MMNTPRTPSMYRVVPCLLLAFACAACADVGPVVPSDGPQFSQTIDPGGVISHWTFDEGGGAVAHDVVNANHGTIHGGAVWTDGVCGQALSFDGVDDYVDAGNDLSLNGDVVTVEFWFKPQLQRAGLVGKGGWREDGWSLFYHDPHNLCHSCVALFVSNYAGDRTFVNSPPSSITPDEWSFVTFVLNRSYMGIFINGEFSHDFIHSFDYDMNPDRHLFIGKFVQFSSPAYFKGLIDEVAIYDRVLTAEEIRQRYQDAATCGTIPVVIDIKPGSVDNPINLESRGNLPVAVLTTSDFDAAAVNAATVTLGDGDGDDTPVVTRMNGGFQARMEDVDGDGDDDLLIHFDSEALVANGDLVASTTQLVLNGNTTEGVPIQGSDHVRIVR